MLKPSIEVENEPSRAIEAIAGAVPEAALEVAAEPIMVGGAYLVCVQSDSVECRLDAGTSRNIAIPAALKVQFFNADESIVTHSDASLAGFRWRLNNFISTPPISRISLKLTSPNGQSWLFRSEVENQAVQIGDGTTQLQGCTLSFVRSSNLVGLTYERSFAVREGESAFIIELTGLCGIARSNDSLLRVLDASQREVFTRFLPVTAGAISLSLTVEGVSPGVYSVVLIPGDNIDIDDFFINSLAISSLAR